MLSTPSLKCQYLVLIRALEHIQDENGCVYSPLGQRREKIRENVTQLGRCLSHTIHKNEACFEPYFVEYIL